MPKIQAIGRNLGLLIDRNIALGFQLKRGDEFILDPKPEENLILIRLRKKDITTEEYIKNIKEIARKKDARKRRLHILKVKVDNLFMENWLPQEIKDLKVLKRGKHLNKETKNNIKEILAHDRKRKEDYKARLKRLKDSNKHPKRDYAESQRDKDCLEIEQLQKEESKKEN